MTTFNLDIAGREQTLRWEITPCQFKTLLAPILVEMFGAPEYLPTGNEVGSPRREIVVEPQPISTPVPETVPSEPVPA